MNLLQLITIIKRYLKRTDLDDLLPDWIEFAQRRIDMDMRLPEQEFRSTTTPTTRFISLPLDWIEMRNIQVNFDGNFSLQYLTPEQLDNASRALKGDSPNPIQFYTIMDTQLELVPPPTADSEVTLEMFYYARQASLASDEDTTKVLLVYPQLYIYAVMVEAMPFLEHAAGQASWFQMYTDYARLLNERAQAGRFSGNSIQMRAV